MEFFVKLIEVNETTCADARNDLQRNCCHVANNYWLFEGDEDALHNGIDFDIVDELAIEGYGDLKGSQIRDMVADTYNVDKRFL